MKTLLPRLFTLGLLCLFIPAVTFAQAFDLYGIIDDKLVKVNTDGTLELVLTIADFPTGTDLKNLTFVPEQDAFYAMLLNASEPTLVRISRQGQYTRIGRLRYQNQDVPLCDALAYNSVTKKMYGGVSLNGGVVPEGDYESETIVEINLQTAECTVVTQVNLGADLPDVDEMGFDNNVLYFHDSHPNISSNFYRLSLDLVPPISTPQLLVKAPFHPLHDLTVACGSIFFSTGNRTLHRLDLNTLLVTLLGTTHTVGEYNGRHLRGLSKLPVPPVALDLGPDTTLCTGESLALSVGSLPGDVLWSTGSTDTEITVVSAGTYSVTLTDGFCTVTSDTITVNFSACQTCPTDQISLGNDTTLCEGQILPISLNIPDATITWSDGTTGPSIQIAQAGTYTATVQQDTCTRVSLPITVTFLACEGCPTDPIVLGPDTTLCEGDTLPLTLNIPGATITWNDGTTGSTFLVTTAGTYQATVQQDTCTRMSLPITVAFETCEGCPTDPVPLGPDLTLCSGSTTTLSLPEDIGAVTWRTGATGPTLTVSEPGLYWATIQDGDCTQTTDTIAVTLVPCETCELAVPNAFSPNNDGNNDIFQAFWNASSCQIENFQLQIFDRWGNIIHLSSENAWDGLIDGRPAQAGVYVYLMEYAVQEGGQTRVQVKSGEVILVR